MTHRIYIRYPDQRVSHKTVTPDEGVASLAFRRLIIDHAGEAAAVTWTRDGINQQYVQLDHAPRTCERCYYRGPFIDEGETCPQCTLVQ